MAPVTLPPTRRPIRPRWRAPPRPRPTPPQTPRSNSSRIKALVYAPSGTTSIGRPLLSSARNRIWIVSHGRTGTRVILALMRVHRGSRLGHTDGRLQQPRAEPTEPARLHPLGLLSSQVRADHDRWPGIGAAHRGRRSRRRRSGRGLGAFPSPDPGPGIVGSTQIGTDNTNELGPVCPVTAPTNGAPSHPPSKHMRLYLLDRDLLCTTDWNLLLVHPEAGQCAVQATHLESAGVRDLRGGRSSLAIDGGSPGRF